MSETPQIDPVQNPKAAAKAAKAYAKATRPWYKKKRWWLLAVIVLIIVISVASNSGGSGVKASDPSTSTATSSGASTSTSPTTSSDVGTKDNPAPQGTAVQNKSAKYQITGVEVRDSLGQFAPSPAGRYVVVTVSVTNVKSSTIDVSDDDATLEVNGTEIDASNNGLYLDDTDFGYTQLSPTLTKTGTFVFDVPANLAGQGVVKFQAILSSDEPVYLSLQ